MAALIVYDSKFGNTQKVAEAIGNVFGENGRVVRADEFTPDMLTGVDILIVGSPIQGWRPSEATSNFLDKLQKENLSGMMAAAFDTGFASMFAGNAAKRIARELQQAGCRIIVPPKRFLVMGAEGPLAQGELDNARDWARQIVDISSRMGMHRAA